MPPLIAADLATNVTFLPPIRRRRLSQLSKLSLRLAHECVPGYQGYCVFGSQHGELVTTQGLLASIVQGEVVSPAGFSASVHNTAVGLHSIHNQNTYPCSSLAAGRDTLAMCFIEAYGLLASGAVQVLVVYADDGVPEPLNVYIDGANELHGLACLITHRVAGKPVVKMAQCSKPTADKKSVPFEALITFLSLGDQGAIHMRGESVDWRWEYSE